MKTAPLSAALIASTFLLAGCGAEQTPPQQPAAPPSTPASAAPANQTEAIYGDEAPVTIDAPQEADHGHLHDDDGDHSHDDEHEHNADGSHPDDKDDHDHEDDSSAHGH